ncbi:MAG TPA: efflux RND transporter periplasmic adaptor subunit [Terriglobia bacterium]|nr:efflux RND transporter periplasmic adaptor subunit [Terriglobia bacterium]
MVHRSSFYFVGIAALLTVSLAACSQQGGASNKNGGGRGGRGQRAGGGGQPVDVRTSPVQRISIQRSVELSGTLVSPDQARVSSEVAGIVRDVLVEIGQEVKVGEELVRLDTTELNLALQRAESALRQTEAQLGIAEGTTLPQDDQISAVRTAAANRDDARSQLTRAQELFNKGLSSRADFDTAQTRVKVSEAAYQSAVENVQSLKASLQDRRAAYDLAKKKLSDAIIRAPIAGAIAERSAQRGEYIRENTPVATIVRMNPLKLRTGVQEKYANMIHQNQMVDFQVEPYPTEMFHGKIAYISPAVDQGTRTFTAEILVDNPQYKLKPGFFTKGEILVHRDENVLAVPEETVSNLAGVSSVYVINNGVVKQTTIRTGEHEGKFIEVVEGLKGDEILAASNLNELVSGSRVGGGDEEGATAVGDNGAGGDRRGGKGGGRGGKGGRRSGGEGKGDAQ